MGGNPVAAHSYSPRTASTRMKVLQVSDSYPPAKGGLERTVQALATGLSADGTEVSVATLGRNGAEPPSLDGSVTIHRLDGWTRFLRRFTADPSHQFHPTAPDPALVRRLQEIIDLQRPDIVHAHGWILHSCLRLRLPPTTALVATLHDYGLNCAKKTLVHRETLDTVCPGPSIRRCLACASAFYGAPKGVPLVLGLTESRHRLGRVTMFLPISAAVADACLKGVSPERFTVVPSFVPDTVSTEGQSVDTSDFLPHKDFLLFVGAVGPHKGIDTLLHAHRLMRNPIPLVVIGMLRPDSPPFHTPAGDSAARPVTVLTDLSHEQVIAAMRLSRIVCVPSRWAEPQGLVAIEAMTVGTPVVASDVGGLHEVVHHERTGLLVRPGNTQSLAAALDRLLEDPGLRTQLVDAGRIRAHDYTESTVIPDVRRAYTQALARRSAGL
ncbi:glycosyltransferase family 4 protein [Rhodococcus sp. OK302]|uniref:glycosyltransferase family 4 protein n=1 Tax=Rhodococcus sp. OK302 TaxID=1882769 RepID=UPI000B9F4D74|nr:glycosyltransferase family 4 protein [Rhodococcus sp. OK302]OYD68851.1 glycosyltransferase involved in cell wall bisynthesis [Rhodococcus sp. OK302]